MKQQLLKDVFIGCTFMAMSLLLPGSLLANGFEAHIGGVAMGVGIGWITKSYIAARTSK